MMESDRLDVSTIDPESALVARGSPEAPTPAVTSPTAAEGSARKRARLGSRHKQQPAGSSSSSPAPPVRSKIQSTVGALWERSIFGAAAPSWKRHHARARFTNFSHAHSHDTHDPDAANLKLSFLRRRSKIIEIVSAGDVVFALTLSGVCVAFRGAKRLAFLNTTPDEVIRSLFYNKTSHALITVSVYREDNFASLKCRNTPIEYILRGQPDAGFPIFASECLKWPGFVEFDDVNGKVLTYSAQDHAFRVWGMINYEQLYTIPGDDVTEVKISPGIMLLIHQRQNGHVPLRIVSIADGSTLTTLSHTLERAKKVDFIEQFNEKLLVKQEGENLHIVDVHTRQVVIVDKTEFVTPSAFVFLYENNLFLTFRERQVTVWNFLGEQVTAFEDHVLCHPETNTNNFFITAAQDYIISYCRPRDAPASSDPRHGTVHISHILTGKCVARLNTCSSGSSSSSSSHGLGGSLGILLDQQDTESSDSGDADGSSMHSFIGSATSDGSSSGPAHPLGDVTALHFSEERNELFVGNRQGILHVWSH